MDGTVKRDDNDLLAHGCITSGANRGAQVLTSARGSGWETMIRLPKEEEATLWGRYQERAAALRGHDDAMAWIARGPSAARRPGNVDGDPADNDAREE
jgi:hypothetical protein